MGEYIGGDREENFRTCSGTQKYTGPAGLHPDVLISMALDIIAVHYIIDKAEENRE